MPQLLQIDVNWCAILGAALTESLTVCVLSRRVVKEEISDDNAKLPCFNGRVVSWVSETDGALLSVLDRL